ncbi:ABC transporter ATP-binding protein [Bosea sp. OK403]|uniref:ABC transporter ATP-binding protein n=1 Tax=Bosea sp. OK403 TaxID=1855286 RepID=UPI000B861487|nr:ABC transporter ATP-binding protein [Bosea sp. OK403]
MAPARPKAADIAVEDVQKSYGSMLAVRGVSFEIEPGHVLSLLGPSGCGKTTIMRMIAGLIDPTAGDIRIGGRSVTATPVHRRNIGMLFQNYALFPHLTVARNLAFGLEMRKVPAADIARRVAETLALVQLSAFAERLPHQLSGGQQQRVGLARALIVEPSVLLLDEPFGALDKKLRESMQIEMRQLQQRLGITTLMVTHDQDEALTLSDRIAVMNNGRIEQIGAPKEIYERPATRFVASFIGTSNFFEGRVTRREAGSYLVTAQDGTTLALDGTPPASGQALIAVRPESVRIAPAKSEDAAPNQSRMIVEQVVYHGVNTHFYLRRANGEPLIAVRQNDVADDAVAPITAGSEVLASWAADRNRLLLEGAA